MPVRSVSKLALLMVAATLGVHGARALLVLGSGADRALATHGHGNLGPAVAAVVIGVALLLALLLSRAAGAVAVRGRRRSVLRRLWPAATVALLALYGGQELLQGWTTSGHPAGLDALLADGGWVAIPAALGLGLMIALSLRVARVLAERCGRRMRAPRLRAVDAPAPIIQVAARPSWPERPLARHLAGRAPPPVWG